MTIPQLIKARMDLEESMGRMKRRCSPSPTDERDILKNKTRVLKENRNDIQEKIVQLKSSLETIEKEDSTVNKMQLTRVYQDIKQSEMDLKKIYKKLDDSLKLKIQQMDLLGDNEFKIEIDDEENSHYSALKQQEDLTTQGNKKMDSAIKMGQNILGMFNEQGGKMKRIFGNLNSINSDARFSDWLATGINRRNLADKRLVYFLGFSLIIFVFVVYFFFKGN